MRIEVDRVKSRLKIDREDLPKLRANAADPAKDAKGGASGMVAMTVRAMGISEYVLHQDVATLRTNLRESASIQLRLFERFEAGEPIDPTYCTMLAYKDLFDALAAGDFEASAALARHMGWRGEEAEAKHAHPFDFAMGYVLRSFVLNDEPTSLRHLSHFRQVCGDKDNRNFEGYAEVFAALLARDLSSANTSLMTLVKGHEKESKGSGMFANLLDRYLCVWGIGMANLCRWRGLKVSGLPPLIPAGLLV